MENALSFPTLALVSYRVSNDPTYLKELPRQIQVGVLDTGEVLMKEDADVLSSFLQHISDKENSSFVSVDEPSDSNIWIG